MIDGKKIMEHSSGIDHEGKMDRKDIGTATITLEKGLHPFSFIYYKNTWATVPVLGLFVQGRGNYRQPLNDDDSYPAEDPVGRMIIKPTGETVMQRSFLMYKGAKKMYCISVADPLGVHYSFDLSTGSLLQVWKGAFADATGMWHVRGNQILEVLGSPLLFAGQPQFTMVTESSTPPNSLLRKTGFYQLKGYDLAAGGKPVFRYKIAGVTVADALYPDDGGKMLARKLSVSSADARDDLSFRVVEATTIDRRSNGEYYINDGAYFIRFNSSVQATVKETTKGVELVVLLKKGANAEINYSVIW
jgi:hypothetical protein